MTPAPSEVLFSKPEDPRLGDLAKHVTVIEPGAHASVNMLGYADDEGVKNSGGRVGAALGPNQIRKYLYRLTPAVHTDFVPSIRDIGNIGVDDGEIEDRHFKAKALVQSALQAGGKTVTLGGGHDYGYPDGAAFCKWQLEKGHKPLVINFDAHMDVRPVKGPITSGTPFFRLLTEFPEIDFVALGLQSHCNNREQWAWLKDRARGLVLESDYRLLGLGFDEVATKLLTPLLTRSRQVYISIDIDVFSTNIAPGCSQSWPYGLAVEEFMSVYRWILARASCPLLGIYETAPTLDVGDVTAKLAANLAHTFIFEGRP